MNSLSIKKIYLVGVISLILGILFDYLFYDKPVGISLFIYVVLLTSSLFWLLFFFNLKYSKIVTALLPVILFFSLMAGVRANEFLLFWNIVMTLGLLLLLASQIIGRNIREMLFIDYLLLPLKMLAKAFSTLGRILFVTRGIKGKNTSQITKGILITLPIVIFFIFLLSAADLVFKDLVTSLFNFNFNLKPDLVAQIWWAIVFTVAWLGAYTFTLENASVLADSKPAPLIRSYKFGNIEAGILFTALNALFLTFVIIQIRYLFAGHEAVTQLGFTYAEYAHKGFGELITVALLVFGLIFLVEKYIERSEEKTSRSFKILSGITVAFVLVIMASAFTRLEVYEQAYGFTLLRILVQAFIIWLVAVFLWLGYKIVRGVKNRPFAFGLIILIVAFFTAFNLLNPDSFVPRRNIEQFAENGGLDTKYLSTLSADALPELIPLLERPNLKDKAGQPLSVGIATILKSNYNPAVRQPWQSYNISRHRAIHLIDNKWELILSLTAQNSSADYKNAAYQLDGLKIQLQDGETNFIAGADSTNRSTVRYFGNEVWGDFNNDGYQDIAFILTKDNGGSGTFYYLVAALNNGFGYNGTSGILLGDRISPQTTEFRDNEIIVNYAVRPAEEPMTATPSIGVSKYFKVNNGELVEVVSSKPDLSI